MEKIERLNLAKECISGGCGEDDKMYSMFLLCCYGLLDKFGSEYSELIKLVFSNSNFFIEDKPLQELISRAGYNYKVVKGEKACSFTGVFATLDTQLNFGIDKEKPSIFINTTNISANDLLITFTHEISHIIKGLIRNVIVEPEENIVAIRCGLSLAIYNTENRDLNREIHNNILDELTTVFQTADMMNSICQIERELLDDKTKLFYDKLKTYMLKFPSGYEKSTPYFKPLWENDCFKDLIDSNVIMGNIEKIEEEFDGIMGENKFRRFSLALDNLYCENYTGIKKLENDIILKKMVYDYNRLTKKAEKKKLKS